MVARFAIDARDRPYESGNYSSRVDVAAPGVEIFTLAGQGFGPTTGTSPAAAAVSGVVALLLELRPGLTPEEVRTLLKETARPLGAGEGRLGAGAVDACRAASKLTGGSLHCR